jgi:hypothetical protein
MAMNRNVKFLLAVVAAGTVCIVMARGSMLSAQQRPAPDQSRVDVSAALLAEVRALRADLAQANQTGVRAQLLMARVQLQEQRVMYFDRRRADLATRTAEAAERSRQTEEEVKDAEERLRQIRAGNAQTPLGGLLQLPKDQLEGMVKMFEGQIEKHRADAQAAAEFEQRMRIEEAEVQSALAAEQGRWSDFNARLDELERALPK